MNGYSHPAYAASLSEFGTPRPLVHSGGWVLERPIPQTTHHDAMGCYPIFTCLNWSELHRDLEELQDDFASLAIVADPFGEYDVSYLQKCFSDRFVPFKEHMVTDLSQLPESFVHQGHRRNARKALELLNVELCSEPSLYADEWNTLYANLIKRHGIQGLSAFSAASFKSQLTVPGISMFRATHREETVGMTLWYADRGIAYYHLGAYSDSGYDLQASFALFWRVIEHFSSLGLRWLNLGAGAGLAGSNSEDGLTRFKRGWATDTRTAYFCGRILDQQKYDEIVRLKTITGSDYFPAYRRGEFG